MAQFRVSQVFAVCAAMALTLSNVRAEDAAPAKDDKAKADAATPAPAQGRGGRGNWGGGAGGGGAPGGNAFGGGGMAGGRGMGGFGGGGGIAGTGGNGVISIASRALGVDIQDPKAVLKVEELPLGAQKHFVTLVPVGGVDNLSNTGKGWNMENIFTMTPEQTKSVEALREEYQTEEKKLQTEIAAQEKALADKAIELRQKFEQRANDLLTGADKESKAKLDALSVDVHKKSADLVAETLPLYDMNDFQQGFALIRALSDKMSKITKDGEAKLVELVPETAKDKVQTLIKSLDEARDRSSRFMQGGPGGGMTRGRNGPGGTDAVKPPKPPDTTDNKF